MNVHESARLRQMLLRAGLSSAATPQEAGVIIFQTCSIRDTAAQKVITHIHQALQVRRKMGLKQKICVIGCLDLGNVQGVDIVLGTNKLEELVERLTGIVPDNRFGVENSIIITHGCDNFCAYCIVPYARGREWSRDVEDIVHEFEQIKETAKGPIFLLGQNVNSYHCPRTGTNFVGLLNLLCALKGEFVVNFLSSHPKDFGWDLVECIARNPKIERNIHLPMQSGCDKILRAMKRGYSVAEYLGKVDMLRRAVPDVHITTDIICGFPTETDADFDETCDVVRRVRFNAAFIFPYSPREGTEAANMPQVDERTRRARATRLIEIQRLIK